MDQVDSADDLPPGWGWTSHGQYRLRRRDDEAVFAHSGGPQSWKQFLHPPRQRLWSSDGSAPDDGNQRYAFIGIRGCGLSAIAIVNGVLGAGAQPENGFVKRLQQLYVAAVNYTERGGLCFCASMETGPQAGSSYDLALTERIADGAGIAPRCVPPAFAPALKMSPI